MILRIIKLLKILLLCFSLYGYAEYMYNEKKLKVEFIPAVVLSYIGCSMFFAGILNILEITVICIEIIGIRLSIKYLKRQRFNKKYITAGMISIVITLIGFVILTYKNKFMHYDNFSHWGLIVRNIVTSDAFPNFEDTTIMFQSYPTGSASFIYFFSKATGITSEWFFLCVQQLLIICSLCTIFVFCRQNSITENIGAFITVFVMIISNNNITEALLVDTLLSSIGIAGMTICVFYKDTIEQTKAFIAPIIMFLISIKNSGAFFVVAILGYYIYKNIKGNGYKNLLSNNELRFMISPFLTFLLWDKHVEIVFKSGMTAKHSMSVENYKNIFGEKTIEEVSIISSKFIEKVFSLKNPFWLMLVIFIVTICILKYKKIKTNDINELLCITAIFYSGYQIGMYFMYLFSMPGGEALSLAGYDRYHKTIITFLGAFIFIFFLKIFQNIDCEVVLNKLAFACLCLWLVIVSLKPNISYLKKQVYEGSDRQAIDRVVENNIDITANKRYAVIWKSDTSGYYYFLCRYALNTTNYSLFDAESINNESEITGYDCLLIVSHTEKVDNYLNKHFGTADKDVYTIS